MATGMNESAELHIAFISSTPFRWPFPRRLVSQPLELHTQPQPACSSFMDDEMPFASSAKLMASCKAASRAKGGKPASGGVSVIHPSIHGTCRNKSSRYLPSEDKYQNKNSRHLNQQQMTLWEQ
ncbi:hypothetical protein ZWY2020_020238 [Hordeum vulgare]|nr:hypothetical protein ZWY2020_020238 [Hordeum vulgare]